MAIRDVLQIGNPILRKKSAEVTGFGPLLQKTLDDMRDTLTHLQKTKKIGRALAAPQISLLKRIIYIQTPDITLYMINPEISYKSSEMFEVWDSCFSFDVSFFVKINRHKSIAVNFQDETGKNNSGRYSNGLSELLQHEIDHLDGILATDHLIDPKNIIMRSEWEKLR
ncbi:MAG TPA: peptide deformylase [Spirochaetota bacterium]|nr:peptide deformylase [Spirochaetota bacterium]